MHGLVHVTFSIWLLYLAPLCVCMCVCVCALKWALGQAPTHPAFSHTNQHLRSSVSSHLSPHGPHGSTAVPPSALQSSPSAGLLRTTHSPSAMGLEFMSTEIDQTRIQISALLLGKGLEGDSNNCTWYLSSI